MEESEEGEEITVNGELVGDRVEDRGEAPNEPEFCQVVRIFMVSIFPFF